MPRRQVLVSAEEIARLLADWQREDRVTARERNQWRTQMTRESKAAVKAVKSQPHVAKPVIEAMRRAEAEREVRWDQEDLAKAEGRVNELRRMGAPAEHVLAYERLIAQKRNSIARRLTEVA